MEVACFAALNITQFGGDKNSPLHKTTMRPNARQSAEFCQRRRSKCATHDVEDETRRCTLIDLADFFYWGNLSVGVGCEAVKNRSSSRPNPLVMGVRPKRLIQTLCCKEVQQLMNCPEHVVKLFRR